MFQNTFRYFILYLCLATTILAQDNLPSRSDIQIEIQSDSLIRDNSPQEITLLIDANNAANLDALLINIDQIESLWTVMSAEVEGESLWLKNSESNAGRDDVLAWKYNDNSLHLAPFGSQLTSQLKVVVRLNLLKPGTIQAGSGKEITLLADINGERYRCLPVGNRPVVSFR